MMNLNQYIDATILKPEAVNQDYLKLYEDAVKYNLVAVCIPPFKVKQAKIILKDTGVSIASVVGFPAGYQTISIKLEELRELIKFGVDELDYVVHRGYLLDDEFKKIEEETKTWVSICKENNVVSKWIIESSELSYFQIDKLVEIANNIHPDYVKTSTGVYGKAILEQVLYLRKNLLPTIKIKAAGGISDRETAEKYIEAGANRLGVSQYLQLIN